VPYKHSEKLIPRNKDRRVKLSQQDKIEIVDLYATGMFSYRVLGEMYEVSKSMCIYVVNPERRIRNYALRKARGVSYSGSKKEWSETMKKHRQYKQELSILGKLVDK